MYNYKTDMKNKDRIIQRWTKKKDSIDNKKKKK